MHSGHVCLSGFAGICESFIERGPGDGCLPNKNLPQASDLGRKMIVSPEHLDIVFMTAPIELNH
jgi:hypothetical protein